MGCSFQAMKMDIHIKQENMSEDTFGWRSCTLKGGSSTSHRCSLYVTLNDVCAQAATMPSTWTNPGFVSAHAGANACRRTSTVMYNNTFDSDKETRSFWRYHGYIQFMQCLVIFLQWFQKVIYFTLHGKLLMFCSICNI